jgi:hypothetical protein
LASRQLTAGPIIKLSQRRRFLKTALVKIFVRKYKTPLEEDTPGWGF